MSCGIYMLTSSSGKFYIGSSRCVERRINFHFRAMAEGKHYNVALNRAYKKHGKFTSKILELCTVDALIKTEQKYIDLLKPKYNRSRIASRPEMSKSVRAKISRKLTGRKMSKECKEKIGKAHAGKRRPESWRKKLSLSMIGNIRGLGKKKSIETIAKVVAFHTGRKRSEETCRKISEMCQGRTPWNKGKKTGPLSDETKAKLSVARLGNKNACRVKTGAKCV